MKAAAKPPASAAALAKADQLIEAARSQDADSVAAILAMGAPPDAIGTLGLTPLVVAAEHGASAVVKILLEAGADANFSATNGTTPLRAALLGGDGDCVQLLIELGKANVNLETSRGTPLTTACCEGDVEGVKLLLSHGADLSYETRDGLTALHVAVREDRREVARVLLQHGAKPDQKSRDSGKSALDMAQDKVLPEVASLLMQFTITSAADASLVEAEARQAQGMREANDVWSAASVHLKEESAQSDQEVAATIAELQAANLELKRKLGLIK